MNYDLNSYYHKAIKIAVAGSLTEIMYSLVEFSNYVITAPMAIVLSLMGIFISYGLSKYCDAMEIFSKEYGLYRISPLWKTSRILVIILFIIPQFLLFVLSILGLMDPSFNTIVNLESPKAGFILFFIFLFPILFILYTIIKMKWNLPREIPPENQFIG